MELCKWKQICGKILAVGCEKDESNTHVGAHNLQHTAVDILVCDALDVSIANLLVPNLKRFRTARMG